jgi:hypothetical protein
MPRRMVGKRVQFDEQQAAPLILAFGLALAGQDTGELHVASTPVCEARQKYVYNSVVIISGVQSSG